jgi:hypothetical protein
MTRKRALSYIRMSTEIQLKGHSLERQLALTKAYAKEKGFELVEDLRDIGFSAYDGANTGKGALGEFLKGIRAGTVDQDCVLLVENLDRLSRQNPMRAFTQFSEIIGYGVEIHTISDRQIYTSETLRHNPGQLFLSLGQMLRANSESEEKSKRLKSKWKSKRDNLDKRIYTSICPAWLESNEDKTGFKEIPERVKTIKKIFDLYIDESFGAFSIARYLNQHIDKYPRFTRPHKKNRASNGKHKTGWQKSYIIKILNNPSVHGEFQPHEMVVGRRSATEDAYENYFPAVITKDRFLLAQARKRERAVKGGGRKGETFNNIFTKLVECGNCNGIVHYINKGDPPKGGKYLRCSNAEFRHKCDCSAWSYKDFEGNFFDFVTEVEFGAVLKSGTDKSQKTNLLEEQQVNKEKAKRKEAQLDKLLEFEGSLPEVALKKVREKLEKLSLELGELEKRQKEIEILLSDIESRNSKKTQKDLIEAIKQQQGTANPEERASIGRRIHSQISQVVSKITIHNHSGVFHPQEITDMLSHNVKRLLIKKDYDTEDKIIALFDNQHGRHLFDEMERYFVVHFKNGEEKRIHPYLKMDWKHDDRKFLSFIQDVKEREAQRALDERKKNSKYIKKPKTRKSKAG